MYLLLLLPPPVLRNRWDHTTLYGIHFLLLGSGERRKRGGESLQLYFFSPTKPVSFSSSFHGLITTASASSAATTTTTTTLSPSSLQVSPPPPPLLPLGTSQQPLVPKIAQQQRKEERSARERERETVPNPFSAWRREGATEGEREGGGNQRRLPHSSLSSLSLQPLPATNHAWWKGERTEGEKKKGGSSKQKQGTKDEVKRDARSSLFCNSPPPRTYVTCRGEREANRSPAPLVCSGKQIMSLAP